jgi:hypothetical protein
MTLPRPVVHLALVLAVACAAAAAACGAPAAKAPGQASDEAATGTTPYDSDTTDTARVLAGMKPLRGQAFAPVVALTEWREWESESRERWGAAWSDRVEPLRRWAASALTGEASGCQTLLSPFGGSEFLAAYALFPSCEGYVLVGTEPAGQLPSLDGVTPSQLTGFIDDLRRAFPEVFPPQRGTARRPAARSSQGPRLTGAIPSLLVQLARLDARIVNASRFDITAEGRPLESIPIRGGNARPAALSLTFEVPNGRPQSLVYFPADVDDAAMRRRPGAWTFLRMQAPFATLLAPPPASSAASCSLLRDLIRDQSRVVLQARPAWTPLGAPDWSVTDLPPLPGPASQRSPALVLALRQVPAVKAAGRR